ncbi:hypothetical protein C8J57DRAFT_1589497 [Mycena rebaudengoi]|nr:hypothetical protein C8J57DRAFT_1589497 [Mycena rebaudengoi]
MAEHTWQLIGTFRMSLSSSHGLPSSTPLAPSTALRLAPHRLQRAHGVAVHPINANANLADDELDNTAVDNNNSQRSDFPALPTVQIDAGAGSARQGAHSPPTRSASASHHQTTNPSHAPPRSILTPTVSIRAGNATHQLAILATYAGGTMGSLRWYCRFEGRAVVLEAWLVWAFGRNAALGHGAPATVVLFDSSALVLIGSSALCVPEGESCRLSAASALVRGALTRSMSSGSRVSGARFEASQPTCNATAAADDVHSRTVYYPSSPAALFVSPLFFFLSLSALRPLLGRRFRRPFLRPAWLAPIYILMRRARRTARSEATYVCVAAQVPEARVSARRLVIALRRTSRPRAPIGRLVFALLSSDERASATFCQRLGLRRCTLARRPPPSVICGSIAGVW